jgi:hypothetical protein
VSVAVGARKCQIRQVVATAMLFRANVLDVEREEKRSGLGQVTILTSFSCPLPNELANGRIHYEAAFRSSRVRAFAWRRVMKWKTAR